MTTTYLAAAEQGQAAAASGIFGLTWLLIALPLAGAAVLLLGGRRTDPFGHLLGTGTVGCLVPDRAAAVRHAARP